MVLRKQENELGAARPTVDAHRAAVTFDDRFRDRQTETASRGPRDTRCVHLVEAIEDMRYVLGRDACPGIRHGETCVSDPGRRVQLDDATGRCVAKGVGDQVLDHLFQAIGVGKELIR